jgi:hypothetical protein
MPTGSVIDRSADDASMPTRSSRLAALPTKKS